MSIIVRVFYTNPVALAIPRNPILKLYDSYQNSLLLLLNIVKKREYTATPDLAKLETRVQLLDGQYVAHLLRESPVSELGAVNTNKSLYTKTPGNNPKNKRGFNKKKAAAIAGLVTGIVSIIVSIFVVLPGMLIHNISDILTKKVGALQTHQSIRYRRKTMPKIKDVFSRDGRIGSKIMGEMKASGYDFRFEDPANPNKITNIYKARKLIPNDELGLASKEINTFIEARHPFAISRWKTRRMKAFYKRFGIQEISPIGLKNLKLGETPEEVANKQSFSAIDEGAKDTSISPEVTDTSNLSAEEKAARNIAIADAENAVKKNKGLFSKLRSKLLRGKNISGSEEAAALEQLSSGVVSKELGTAIKGTTAGLASKSVGFVRKLTISGTLDGVCRVKKTLRAAVISARVWRARSMIKYAANFIKASDGAKKGAASMALLAVMLKRISSTDSSGANIGSSSGFSYALRNKFSKSHNNTTRSSVAVDGELTGVYKKIQKKTKISGCRIYQNPLTQIGEGVVTVLIAVFSGGLGSVTEEGFVAGTKLAVTTSINKAIEKATLKSVLWGATKFIGKTVAIQLSFEGILTLTQMYAQKSLGLNFTGQESGGLLGNILVGGAGGMSKQRSLLAGFVPATTKQYAQANTRYLAQKKQEIEKESFYSRIFDYKNVDSLAFSQVSAIPINIASAGLSLRRATTNVLQNPFSIFSSLVGVAIPKISAQSNDEVSFDTYTTKGDSSGIELATDPAGNLLTIMPQDIADIDPTSNTAYLSANGYLNDAGKPIGVFETHVTNCVDNIDTLSVIEGSDQTKPENDCLATQPITKKFKAYLAYQDMMDGLEAEFLPETLDTNSQTANNLNSTNAPTIIPDTGNVRALAKQVLNTPNIVFYKQAAKNSILSATIGKPNQMETRCLYETDAVARSKGFSPSNLTSLNTTLSPVLLNLMLTISKNYNASYGYTTNGCHSRGPDAKSKDNHYNGRAVDIGVVSGVTLNTSGAFDNPAVVDFFKYLARSLPDKSKLGQTDCISKDLRAQIIPKNNISMFFNDACTHIHVSVPRGLNISTILNTSLPRKATNANFN